MSPTRLDKLSMARAQGFVNEVDQLLVAEAMAHPDVISEWVGIIYKQGYMDARMDEAMLVQGLLHDCGVSAHTVSQVVAKMLSLGQQNAEEPEECDTQKSH